MGDREFMEVPSVDAHPADFWRPGNFGLGNGHQGSSAATGVSPRGFQYAGRSPVSIIHLRLLRAYLRIRGVPIPAFFGRRSTDGS
jgi:hypothetical protein